MKSIVKLTVFLFLFSCQSEQRNFSLCSKLAKPYYSSGLKYEGDFFAIKEHFYSNYKKISSTHNTGIVKIWFQVNCHGEAGNFKLESYDLNYKSYVIDQLIIHQLLDLTKGLSKWISPSNDKGEFIDSHKFFAFKIVDGELNDILPK